LIRLNIRVIAASNIDLKIMVDQAKFRDDLLYRLSKAVLKLPPLRERPEDIPTYLSNYLNVIGRNIRISNEVLVHLIKYSWPGNVRELINILEQSNFRASPNEEIRLTHLPEEIKANDNSLMEEDSMSAGSLRSRVEETEKKSIAEALRISKRNKRKAAQYLGIQRSLLYNKMKKYKLDKDIS